MKRKTLALWLLLSMIICLTACMGEKKGEIGTTYTSNNGIEFTVNEAEKKPVISVEEVSLGEYQGCAWDVAISNFDSAMTYMAKFVAGEEEKIGEIGFENAEVEGGSIAFAVFLRTSRVNVALDIVAE